MSTDDSFRLLRATESEFEAFLIFTANIQNELREFCGRPVYNTQRSPAKVAADAGFRKSIRASEMQDDIEDYMRGVERSEEYFRQIGRELSYAIHCGIANANTVNALFQVLPRLAKLARPAPSMVSADTLNINIRDLQSRDSGMILILPATWLSQPRTPQDPISTNKAKSQGDFQSTVLPFWRSGRWHVAVLRSANNPVVIDPWGLYTSTDLDVGEIMKSVARAFILTPKLAGHSFVTS
jgi:hypothetical protein